MPEIDEEADSLLSNLVLVQNKFDPSVRLVVDMFREEVAKAMKVLLGPPMISDDEAIDVKPVPPYTTPTDVVADTRPLFACRGPFRVPRVRPFELATLRAVVLAYGNIEAVLDVATNDGANRLEYSVELIEAKFPTLEIDREVPGDVVPKPKFPVINEVEVFGSNQNFAVVVDVLPIVTISVLLFE